LTTPGIQVTQKLEILINIYKYYEMKKIILSTFIALLFSKTNYGQSPQFAVVRPNGTTYICPTFDSAYIKALDDDYIYLPGTVMAGNKTIAKRLTLIGAGYYPDSTVYTGKTRFTGSFTIEKKCTIEGVEFDGSITLTNTTMASASSFIRIKCGSLILGGANDIFIDGCVITSIDGSTGMVSNCTTASNVFIKNSVLYIIEKILYSSIKNCLFAGSNGAFTYLRMTNTSFSNCFFRGLYTIEWAFNPVCFSIVGNSCNNCINPIAPGQNNYANSQSDTLLVNSPNGSFFDYAYNYHLKPNSPYLTAGDDGTQIGIYGGSSPYKEGAVPSNPHIYFKQVAPATNNNGQLQIQFKVRAGN
jgi:cytoskeletal protein CcmA (bactofilin family)